MTILGLKLGVPRFRVRTLLILVAAIAFAIEGTREGTRWMRFRYRCQVSAHAERCYWQASGEKEAQAAALDKEADLANGPRAKGLRDEAICLRREAEGFRSLANWSKGLALKYEKARRTPWREAPGDPPYRASETMIGDPGW
jgi:hypothetical protein